MAIKHERVAKTNSQHPYVGIAFIDARASCRVTMLQLALGSPKEWDNVTRPISSSDAEE